MFAVKAKEAEEDARNEGGAQFMRYLKDGDTTFRILQEPQDWMTFWEHFDNDKKVSYPCPGTEDCPGCNSEDPNVKKKTKRRCFNVLENRDGVDYVNVYKIPVSLADKMMLRFARNDTITDRDYTISRFKQGRKVEYDIEGGPKSPVKIDPTKFEDPEVLLKAAWDDVWGEGADERRAQREQEAKNSAPVEEGTNAVTGQAQQEPPPFEEKRDEVAESELRSMSLVKLIGFCAKQGVEVPDGMDTVDEIVDWLISQ